MRRADKAICRDATVTMNIAAGGASVATNLDAPVGDKVKLAFKEKFYTMAEVKGRRLRDGKPATLHLEFLENRSSVASVVNPKMQESGGLHETAQSSRRNNQTEGEQEYALAD